MGLAARLAELQRPENKSGLLTVQDRPPGSDSDLERAIALCDSLIDIFAALFNIPSKEIRRSGRTSHSVTQVRQLAMYVAHVVLRLNMKDVGVGFLRDRSTVHYACHQIEDMRDDIEFDRVVVMAERLVRAAFADRLQG